MQVVPKHILFKKLKYCRPKRPTTADDGLIGRYHRIVSDL